MIKKIGVYSFFSGAGFLDLGFEMSGKYEVLFVNEYHKAFMDIYISARKNMGLKEPTYGHHVENITEYLKKTKSTWLCKTMQSAKKNHDLIGFIGGPPCPDFSIGGKNKGYKGENGKLTGTYIKLICKTKPDFFLFENVKGLYRTKKHKEFFDLIKKELKNAGYHLTEKLINAIEFGAPQDRERIILIGFQTKVLKQLDYKTNESSIINNFNWGKNTIYKQEEVFQKNWPGKEVFINNSIKEAPKNIPVELTVEYWFKNNKVDEHPNSKHYFKPKAGLAKFKLIDEGDDLKKSFKRLHRWRYSPTAAYGNNEVHLHPYKERRITVAEALAIQSLPKEFTIQDTISLTDMFKTIGNGVPFLAAKGLAESIYDFLNTNNKKNSNK